MSQAKEQFVHMIHNNSIHFKHEIIACYDSLFHGRIRDHVKLQICNICKSEIPCYKYTITLVSNKKMVWIAEFTQLRT